MEVPVDSVNFYTIGGLAQETGLPISTIRYYERIGLLLPEGRSSTNHRRYNSQSLRKLRFILKVRDMGLTLSDVRNLFGARCGQVQRVLEARIQEIETSLARLSRVRRRLRFSLIRCQSAAHEGLCGELNCL